MEKLLASLEKISHEARSADEAKLSRALSEARAILKQFSAGAAANLKSELTQLDQELDVWQKKINVLAKEAVGRQGMAKHALHWIETLKKAN